MVIYIIIGAGGWGNFYWVNSLTALVTGNEGLSVSAHVTSYFLSRGHGSSHAFFVSNYATLWQKVHGTFRIIHTVLCSNGSELIMSSYNTAISIKGGMLSVGRMGSTTHSPHPTCPYSHANQGYASVCIKSNSDCSKRSALDGKAWNH